LPRGRRCGHNAALFQKTCPPALDYAVFVSDQESASASEFAVSIWNSLRRWLGVTFREPQPGERAGFDVKPPNAVFIVTPKFMANEQVKEALEAACHAKRNIVLLHHIRSGCVLADEVDPEIIPEECQKAIEKAKNPGEANRTVIYTDDLYEECNDALVTKLNLKDHDSLRKNYDARVSARNLHIMKNSAKISKARTMAAVRRKYDIIVTGAVTVATEDLPPDDHRHGMFVVGDIFDTLCKLAPALCIGRNTGEKVTSADPRHTFNLVVVVTQDALKCPQLLEEMRQILESDGNLMFIHNIESCTSFEAEAAKCGDKDLTSLILRAARFTYLKGTSGSVINGMLMPGNVKTDDAKSPRTKQALSSGGGKSYKLEYKNQFSLALAGDGTGEIYNTKFNDKPKSLPGDIDNAIKALFELYDPEKKGTIGFPQFAEVDRIVTESLGGQYNEMISRRMYSMMNYPGLTLEANISFTTFHNYHLYVAKQMGAMEGDRDASMHYKYIVDKVKNAKKGKRYQQGKLFDLFITHDGSKSALDLARSVKRSIQAHTPNIRVALCNEKVPGKTDMTHAQLAAAALNVLLLLSENCLKESTPREDLISGAESGAQVLVMTHLCGTPSLEAERKKGPVQVQAVLSRPPVIEYWKKCDSACCVKLLELLAFPVDANTKRPVPN
jgi:hypothetical protein